MVTESGSEPICGIVHTNTYSRYSNPDDNLIRSLTAFPIDSPRTASPLECKWYVYVSNHPTCCEKGDVLYINVQSFHVCLHYTVYHTAYCGAYVHVHVASTVNGFGYLEYFL